MQAFDHNRALFADGREVPFDVLVLAVGVRPNVSLLEDAGAAVGRGILTDSHMRTSLEDIYAAGDCVESLDITTGRSRILALLPNAYCQGETAGAHMAGGDKTFDNAIPMNAIGFFGLHMVTAGSYDGEVVDKSEPGMVKKLFYRDDKLKGFILIGQVEKAGIYTSLIRNQTPLHTLDFALICEKPTLLAFERQYRDQKLGGVV